VSKSVQCPCVDPSGTATCRTLGCTSGVAGHECESFLSSNIAGCYCWYKMELFSAAGGGAWLSGLLSLVNDDVCSGFARSVGLAMFLQVVLSVSTLVVNYILQVGTQNHKSLSNVWYIYIPRPDM
jgi:hypothetical protein